MDKKQTILITDDSELNRTILVDMLEDEYQILEATNGQEAIDLLQQRSSEISLVLLDLVMPVMDGFEALSLMNRYGWIEDIPVIMISAETASTYIERAYDLGASDFVSRPFIPSVVHRRIRNTLTLYAKQKRMMELVTNQIYEKEKNNNMMVNILSHIVESRNGECQLHVHHVNTLTGMLLQRLLELTPQYHFGRDEISIIQMASSLHDIGKITIPDSILNKPGRLTPEEFDIMKMHSVAGSDMLDKMTLFKNEPLVRYARQICRWHHERWDGRGYPDHLKGDEIPIAAQVVAIADVYDALTSPRCYKGPYTHEESLRMILNGECGTFNPLLLECLQGIEANIPSALSGTDLFPEKKTIAQSLDPAVLKDMSYSHTMQHLENEQNKRQLMFRFSDEYWFEISVSPSALLLSPACQRLTGFSSHIPHPELDSRVLSFVGEDALAKILQCMRKPMQEQSEAEALNLSFSDVALGNYYLLLYAIRNDPSDVRPVSYLGKLSPVVNE